MDYALRIEDSTVAICNHFSALINGLPCAGIKSTSSPSLTSKATMPVNLDELLKTVNDEQSFIGFIEALGSVRKVGERRSGKAKNGEEAELTGCQ
ncbi:hypothetical protein [Pseudomonas sp. NPDC089734]|uniref:hypothetical protein n=1 Tax=Pseudomonas sp. NPDC089734 TaxID=3364469 RepID=UPI0037F7C5F6